VALTGCTHLGPKTVAVDRFDYSAAIADSWKQQTLLNIKTCPGMRAPLYPSLHQIHAGVWMTALGAACFTNTLTNCRRVQH
jgi:hypothetical protein